MFAFRWFTFVVHEGNTLKAIIKYFLIIIPFVIE